MLVGYARVSTQDQTLNLQKDALKKLGCNKIFTDTASGTKAERRGLEEVLSEGGVMANPGSFERPGASLTTYVPARSWRPGLLAV